MVVAVKGTRIVGFVVGLALLSACPSNDPVTAPKPVAFEDNDAYTVETGDQVGQSAQDTSASGLDRFSKQRAMIHLRQLASEIGVRVKATRNETLGARYIRSKLIDFGYEVTMQKFSVDGGTSRNVVAQWPGARRYGFVVGGHMDSVPGAPGANDNASGVATIIELARIFAGTEQAQFLTFVAFGSEEKGQNDTHHDGSYHFVDQLGTEGRNRLAGMLSVDMIADGRPLLIGHSDIAQKPIVARTVFNKMDKAGFRVHFITLCDCSDHGPFEHAGIPAAFAYSGREPNYHSPSDTVGNLVPNDLLRTGRAVRAFLMEVDKAMLDRFRRA